MDHHNPHPTHPLIKVELGEGDYKHCLPGTEVPIATCSRFLQRYFGLAHRRHTNSIIGEATLQAIVWKLMGIGSSQQNVTSKSGIDDLSHNVFVGLDK
jgi:hypothetical protein